MFDERALRALLADVVRQVLREERPPPTPSEYVSVADAARRAAVTPQTIRTWMSAGRLGRYQAGRELRVKTSELEELLSGGARPKETLSPEEAAARELRRRLRKSA